MDYLNLLKEREKEKTRKEKHLARINALQGKNDGGAKNDVNNPERQLEDLSALHMLISQQFESKPKEGGFTIGGSNEQQSIPKEKTIPIQKKGPLQKVAEKAKQQQPWDFEPLNAQSTSQVTENDDEKK
ncbi:hypothetical protein FGO68_gene2569 [Halteria grandinella]|uniref:Uncharacterized protein n=1 Tax=Halteria grandinella TaxID=5974 RepID=A0A8J8P340_HALGN|nr:hypothetical protein FGO68_gene2569 [Halteria grandinella]